MLETIKFAFYIWFMMIGWQLMAAPFFIIYFKEKLSDGGWSVARIGTWLVSSLLIWFLAHFQIPINTFFGVWLIFIFSISASFIYYKKNSKEILSFLKKKRFLIVTEEIVFFLALFFMLFLRSYNPKILDLEKFMDAGYITAYMRSPTLPADDMWLADYKMNYYTFGHFMGSVSLQYLSSSIDYGFNFLLALIFALMSTQVFAIIYNLLDDSVGDDGKKAVKKLAFLKTFVKKIKASSFFLKIIPGLIASFLIAFAGNSQTIWYFITNSFSFEGYWYPDATRFIYHTIHEFPAYSFLVCDLHAHVWGIPIVLLFLTIVYVWIKSFGLKFNKKDYIKNQSVVLAIVMGVIFGIMMMTNAWDVAIYGLLLAVLGSIILAKNFTKNLMPMVLSAAAVILMLVVTSAPWWMNFVSISEGIESVEVRSSLNEFLTLWTGHITVSLVALVISIRELIKVKKSHNKSSFIFIIALVVVAWILLLLPEFIYVKDIYPDHPRANTMFKLTFQAFIMMTLSACFAFGYILKKKKLNLGYRVIAIAPIILFISFTGIYSFFGHRDYYGLHKDFSKIIEKEKNTMGERIRRQIQNYSDEWDGLDGLAWLEKKHPSDYAAIEWLNNNVNGRPNIVEAVGESYTEFARVSAFTGLPTVLGWRVHEWLWRGSFEIPGKRTDEVKAIYEQPSSDLAIQTLNKYSVKYIILGDKEREEYKQLDEATLLLDYETVFNEGETYILAL